MKLFGIKIWGKRVAFEEADTFGIYYISSRDGFRRKGNNNSIFTFLIAVSHPVIT